MKDTMKLTRTERDTGEDNDRETLGQGKTKNQGGTVVVVTSTLTQNLILLTNMDVAYPSRQMV